MRREISAPSDEGVQAGAVRQTGIDIGRRLIEAATREGRETLGEPRHRIVITEAHRRPLEPSPAIDPDIIRAIDQDVRDIWIDDK
jgi:hypothetical protein